MKKAGLILLLFLFVIGESTTFAQQLVNRQGFEKSVAQVSFSTTTHDFGQIKEEDGPVRFTFEFTNTGELPVKVTGVQASCGCTTPNWTKEEVKPGEKGFVIAEYNPTNRPGEFNKTLTVTTSADQGGTYLLQIKGNVKPRPRTPKDDFPTEVGQLRVKYRGFNLGTITTEKPVTQSFEVYNQGDKPLTFSKEVKAPEHIQVTFEPASIPPKTRGNVNITYDPIKKNDLGWVSDNVVIMTNEAAPENSKDFSVMATIEEYFPPMTEEELAKAPRLQLDRTIYEFGSAKEGDVVETQFVITNKGNSDLNIRKTRANCGCTVSTPEKDTLKPGESTNINVRFDTRGRRGNQYKTVTIFSNDPTAPTQMVTIKGEVKQ